MRISKYLFLLLLAFFHFIPYHAKSIIKDNEIGMIKKMLVKAELDSNSINFVKDWSGDTHFKLEIVKEILSKPLSYCDFVTKNEEIIENKDVKEIIRIYQEVITKSTSKRRYEQYFELSGSIDNYESLFDYVDNLYEFSDTEFRKAFRKLKKSELDTLKYLSLTMWQESKDSVKFKKHMTHLGIKQFKEIDIEDVIPIIKKIDMVKLFEASYIMQTGFDVLESKIESFEFCTATKTTRETKWGKFCIGTRDDDKYDGSYALIIDPGGNDIYKFGPSKDHYSIVIDLKGNDTYSANDIGGLFYSNFGSNIHLDKNGDDIYLGQEYSFSTFIGYQYHHDCLGEDVYKSGLYSLGAATFGLSIFKNDSGNDMYSVSEYGEGFGSTLGAGIFIDYSGNDIYHAGGKYLHAPLAPFDHRAMSQGFGFGLRPFLAGGVGVLYDKSGNDFYNGGVYSQAVAYWYALGIIIDQAGNDFYNSVYYPQGSGIHLAGGFLFDREGEDHYYSKHGPGQGAGHDYSVGFLVDRAGDDSYSIEGGNGLGLTNSVGVFLDVSGNDRYERKYNKSYGFSNVRRNTGGIGIFLDTGGKDSYPANDTDTNGLRNDAFWVRGTYGIGLDTNMVKIEKKIEKMAGIEAVKVDSTDSIKNIFAIAASWGVGSGKKKVDLAAKILLKRDMETAEFIYNNVLNSRSSLVYRAMKNYAKKSKEFPKFFDKALANDDSVIVRNTIALIGELSDTTYVDKLIELTKNKSYKAVAISALGRMKTDNAVKALATFISDDSEKIRVIVARGFKKIDSIKSRQLLQSMKNDSSFLIKTMLKLMDEKNNTGIKKSTTKK